MLPSYKLNIPELYTATLLDKIVPLYILIVPVASIVPFIEAFFIFNILLLLIVVEFDDI